mmetsp:Transcript_30998/g.51382  ORF Transcript_30998/g.51382 Transcript_30998/m.51382 type:complete len:291 (-) Transcript_30998:645-1517(-)|eukprot:CAMPEP_0119340742 /NCGR_PEP_ID=MMETSP1333-20130426/100953_1 /TAXON_ID=418940 /ORGANISM="Scyphosphaera apsteinii, Strain RCC1455" /LENGTH=290 /DNA_ID=CAMNT_0007352557 /DNA_START=80 /DNA_END=952 /DNA_ORIENTATION=+
MDLLWLGLARTNATDANALKLLSLPPEALLRHRLPLAEKCDFMHVYMNKTQPFVIARTYVQPMVLSANPHCNKLGASHCFVQVPKTGSTALKHGFELPINLNSSARSINEHLYGDCRHVLFPFRDPLERFISGLGTVYHRVGKHRTVYDLEFTQIMGPDSLALHSFSDLEAYCRNIISFLQTNIFKCKGLGTLTHLLPQVLFAAVLPPQAQLYGATIEALDQGYVTYKAGNVSACAPHLDSIVNFEEGAKEAPVLHGLKPENLSSELRQLIVDFYKVDYEWLGLPWPKIN